MTQIKFKYLIGNHGNNRSGYGVYPDLTLCPPPSHPDLSPSDISVISYRNLTGYMFSLLLDAFTCDITVINANTMFMVL